MFSMNDNVHDVDAIGYAVIILSSEDLEVTPTRIRKVLDAAGVTISSPFWIQVFSNFFKRSNPKDLITGASKTRLVAPDYAPPKKKEIHSWKRYSGSGLYVKYTNERMIFKDLTAKLDIYDTHAFLTQKKTFENDTYNPLEVIYKFSVAPKESIFEVTASFIDRRTGKVTKLKSRIYEKQEATERYDDIISDGNSAALIERESNGVCSLYLGNLAPNMSCEIEVKSIQEMKTFAGKEGTNTTEFMAIIPSLYDNELRTNIASTYSSIEVSFHLNNSRIGRIVGMKNNFVQHALNIKETGDHCWSGDTPKGVELNHDYEVTVSVEEYPDSIWFRSENMIGSAEEVEGEEEEDVIKRSNTLRNEEDYMDFVTFKISDDEKYLDESSSTSGPSQDLLFLEIVLIVDRSGSMSGGRMRKAVEAMKLCFQSLDVDQEIYFNIVSFGSKHKKLFRNESKKLTEGTHKKVMDFLSRMSADMGGTDIYTPLRNTLTSEKHKNCSRRVAFLLTDGEDGRTDDIIRTVIQSAGKTKIYTFGLGRDIDDVLIKGVAEHSGGLSVFIRENNEIHESVLKILNVCLEPEVAGLHLRKNDQQVKEDQEHSFMLGTGSGKSRAYAWLKNKGTTGLQNQDDSDRMTVHYTIGGKRYKQDLGQGMAFPRNLSTERFAWERIYAKRRIMKYSSDDESGFTPQLLQLALKYELVTKKTSFLMEHVSEEQVIGHLVPMKIYTPYLRVELEQRNDEEEPGMGYYEEEDESSDCNLGLGLFGGDSDDSDDSGSGSDGGGGGKGWGPKVYSEDESDGPVVAPPPPPRVTQPTVVPTIRSVPTPTTTTSSNTPQLVEILLKANIRGYWSVDDAAVCRFLGISKDEIANACPSQNINHDFWITVLMIEFLRKNFMSEEIKWKLMVQKAVRNLMKEGVFDSIIGSATEFILLKDS